jgi:NAD(P)H dehydrogenase (quinone)
VCQIAEQISGREIEFVEVSEEQLVAHLETLGIPRTAEVEFNVDGYAWCIDDMTSFEREVANGRFAVTSNDVETILGRPPKTFRAFAEERADQLRAITATG